MPDLRREMLLGHDGSFMRAMQTLSTDLKPAVFHGTPQRVRTQLLAAVYTCGKRQITVTLDPNDLSRVAVRIDKDKPKRVSLPGDHDGDSVRQDPTAEVALRKAVEQVVRQNRSLWQQFSDHKIKFVDFFRVVSSDGALHNTQEMLAAIVK